MSESAGKRKRKVSIAPISKKIKKEIKEERVSSNNDEGSEDGDMEEFEEFDKNDYKLSELELLRQENMKKNFALFEEFQINQAKHEVTQSSKSKIKFVGLKKEKRVWNRRMEQLPRRVSLRIRKMEADTVVELANLPPPLYSSTYHDYLERKAETIGMVADEADCNFSQIINTWKDEKELLANSDVQPIVEFSSYSKAINSLNVNHCGKVAKSRICSIAVHPTVNKTIAAFGDKKGCIGIWDVGSDAKCEGYPASEEVLLFEPHCSPIQCLKFHNSDCNKLILCSYDGTLRQADFVEQKFNQIFAFEDKDMRCYFFSNPLNKPNAFLTSTSSGTVVMIDSVSGKAEQTFGLFNKNVKCVDCHPSNENIFAAVLADGTCGTWDLRNLKSTGINKPLSSHKASKTGTTAFFSPNLGNKLLYTAYDNYIRVFDVELGGKLSTKPTWNISHDNHTGRWLTSFRAAWDPKTENSFVIGSMGHPRKIDIYGCLPNQPVEWMRLVDENFTTVGSVNAFHPTKNVLFSGNASGKAYVWT